MADTNLGGVYYEVDAKTGNLLKMNDDVSSSIDKLVGQFAKVDNSTKKNEQSYNQAGAAAKSMAADIDKTAKSALTAISAYEKMSSELQQQRASVSSFIAKLKEQNETLGLSATELAQYQAAKLGASEKDQQIVANLRAQIDAYEKNQAEIRKNQAALDAIDQQQQQNKASVAAMVQALQNQAATLGMTTRQIILHKAAQEGATVADRKAIITALNQIEAFERKTEATRRATLEMTKTAQAVNQAAGSMRGIRGVAGNLGFQLQDIAVQAQAGTSAFVILGQQGSQLASAFGPGGAVLGAVIAVASAIGGVLFTSLKETSAEIKDKFNPSIDEMKEKMDELTKAQAEFAIIQLRKDMEPLANVARSTAAQVEYLTKQIQKYPSNKDIVQWNEELVKQQAILDGVNQQIERNQSDLKAYEDIVKRNIEGTQGQQKSEKERAEALAALIKQTTTYAETIGLSARGIALYAAEQNKATQADIDTINALFDTIEAYELKQESVRKATAEQKEYAKAVEESFLKELKAEQDQRNKITTEFEQVQKGITADIETPAQKAERELAERLAVIQKYNQLETVEEARKTQTGVMAQKAYEAQLTKIKKDEEAKRLKMNSDTLGYTADLFGNLAQLAEAGGKKSFNAWKLFASAQAAVNAALAITNVLATVPAPFNFALAGTVAAVTGAQIATINSQSYGGGRLYGGPVQAGAMYPITENGKPEILQQGNKQYLLPGSSGNVISNKDMVAQSGSNVSVEVNVQNMNGSQVDVKRSQGPNRKEIIDIIVADIGNRGQTYRAITSTTSARGTTR
jgi:chromosome segregation ATPase